MCLFERRELVSTIRHYSTIPFNLAETDNLTQELIRILNKSDRRGILDAESVTSLKKTAQLLWDQVISRPVKEKLRKSAPLDLILSIDEDLVSIPWELLYTGEEFLCLKFNVGRVVRTKQQVALPQYRQSQTTTPRMLILANPTNDLKSAYLEGTSIKNQFDRRRKHLSIDFKSTDIDTFYVKKNLRDYDIVHFAGHCEYDPDDDKNSGWVLSDAKFSGQDICALAETASLPSLVFSNACHSALVMGNYLDSHCQRFTYGLASAFLFSGVRHYIGAMRRIEDASSLAFAQEFYSQLLAGKPVGECVRSGRLKLIREYGANCTHWTSYLLYGDPTFAVFSPRARLAVLAPRKLPKKIFAVAAIAIAALCVAAYLYMWLPTLNPNTYLLFFKSHSLFLKGKNEQAISVAQRLLNKEPDFLAIYPVLGDTYLRLGDKENTLRYYFAYASLAAKKQDKKSLVSAYAGIGWAYHLQGEYPKALEFYQKALSEAKENHNRLGEARALERMAVWYLDKDDNDKALELLMKSSQINLGQQHIEEHRYGLACDYFDLGLVYTNKDDFATAREFYQKSRRLFDKLKMKHELSDYYFNLGEINLFEKQYSLALDYYMKGLKIDELEGHRLNLTGDYNMIGELYMEMDNLVEAEKYFNQALSLSKEIDAQPELANAYYDLGLLAKKKGQKNKAREFLRLAQEIYRKMDVPEYQQIKQEFLDLDN